MTRDGASSIERDNPSPWPFDRHEYPIRLRLVIKSDTGRIEFGVDSIMRIARRCSCVDGNETDLEIALHEALANAMIHGNRKDPGKSVFVRCYGAPGEGLVILVRDEGPGFKPERVPDPRTPERMHLHHGRGLLLMRELMDHVEYRKNGREVLLYLSC